MKGIVSVCVLRERLLGILLKHKFNIEWHLNNNNEPSIIFTTLLCRAYRFLYVRMNHAIDKVC